MTPWLAAIDFEVLIWGILAVVYILAQILGQFTKKEEGGESKSKPWRPMPQELREFLEEIQEKAAPEEEEWAPAPARRPAPPPIEHRATPRAKPPPSAPHSTAPAYEGSVKKIDKALEHRRHLFQCQLKNQAEKLNNRRRLKPVHPASLRGEFPAELSALSNMDYLSAGLKGFKLPSLGLPSASASLQERTIHHSFSLDTPDRLREALIHGLILGPPVSETPPGYKNVMTQN